MQSHVIHREAMRMSADTTPRNLLPPDARGETASGEDEAAMRPAPELLALATQAGSFVVFTLLAAVTFTLLGLNHIPADKLVPWALFMTVTAAAHAGINLARHAPTGAAGHWWRPHVFMAVVTAAGWMVAGILFLPGLPADARPWAAALFIAALYAGVSSLSPRWSAACLYALPFLAGLAMAAFGSPGPAAWTLAVLFPATMVLALAALLQRGHCRAAALGLQERGQLDAARLALARTTRERDLAGMELNQARLDLATLDAQQQRSLATLRTISDGVISCDSEGRIEYMNPVSEVLTGWGLGDARGRQLSSVFRIINQETREVDPERINACLHERRPVLSDSHDALVRKDGLEYAIEFMLSPIRDGRQQTSGITAVFRDVTAQRAISNKLSWQATHDPLTRLINRTEFEDRVSRLLASGDADSRGHALCHIDFDCFKAVNDSHGVAVGDALMRKLARSLRSRIRDADTLARIGGDELAVLLHSCPADKARMIAEGLRLHIEQFDFQHDELVVPTAASIGVVAFRAGQVSLPGLMNAAEHACRAAKEAGGALVQVFDSPSVGQDSREQRSASIARVRRALNRDEFVFGISRLQSGRGADSERLGTLELRLPDNGHDQPLSGAILEAAERYQILADIDRWTVKAAIDALRLGHPGLSRLDAVMVPLHAQSIRTERFCDYLFELVGAEGLARDRIIIAIRGSATQIAIGALVRFIAAARHRGLRVAIDDFGAASGGTLDMLRRLDFDFMRLDPALAGSLSRDSADFELVLSLLRVAAIRGIGTVAPGVVSREVYDHLLAAGVDYLGGDWVAEPRPLQTVRIA